MTALAHSRKPSGLTRLSDFAPFLPAEIKLLRAAATGDIAKIGYRRPRAAAVDARVRGEFLAFLARGGDASTEVTGRRLQIMGARIVGGLDLAGARLPLSLWLFRCALGGPVVLDGAQVHGSVSFSDCVMLGLRAVNCRIEGDLALTAGCDVARELTLADSRIGGNLDAARLRVSRGLVGDGLQIGGDVDLQGHAESLGEMRFVSARIGGSFRAGGARLTADVDENGTRGVALNLDRIRMGGDLLLNAGFAAAGTVRLAQARIRGDFDGSDADFDVIGDASWGANGSALRMDRARIDGALVLRRLVGPLQGASLLDARVGALTDDATTWGQQHVLDGFAYTRFGPGAPTDSVARLAWLARQQGAHLDADFRPDPWRRLLRALRRSGHVQSAAEVAIGRERHLRHIGKIGAASPRPLRWFAQAVHGAWGLMSGYGQRPWRLLGAALLVWLVCGAAFWLAAPTGDFASTSLSNACQDGCAGRPAARAFALSFELLVPLAPNAAGMRGPLGLHPMMSTLDLTGAWPALRCLAWLEAACGWLLACVALVDLFGLVDRDRHLR